MGQPTNEFGNVRINKKKPHGLGISTSVRDPLIEQFFS